MNGKIKVAFSEIHVNEHLKKQTYNNIIQNSKSKKRVSPVYKFIPIMVASLLFVFGYLYLTPISFISIDINPSIELSVNTFGRVISAKASNEDAKKILNSVNLNNLNYIDALEKLNTTESFNELIDAYTEITVISENSDEIISDIEQCNFNDENTSVHLANIKLKEEATESGMSFGKYRAYLELLEVNQGIEIKDIENLSMQAIRELIENGGNLDTDPNSTEENNTPNGGGQGSENGSQDGNGQGSENGNQYGNGQGSENGNQDGNGKGNGNK